MRPLTSLILFVCITEDGYRHLRTYAFSRKKQNVNKVSLQSVTGLQRSFTDDANRRILHKCAARLVPSDINSPVSSSILNIMGGVPACRFPGQEAVHRLNRSGGFEMPVWEGQPYI